MTSKNSHKGLEHKFERIFLKERKAVGRKKRLETFHQQPTQNRSDAIEVKIIVFQPLTL
jgi:hypothetical protein